MAKFLATIKWGSCDVDPDTAELPKVFEEAKAKPLKNFKEISKYLRCTFVPSNLSGDVSEILDIADEVDAEKVEITAIDTSSSGLPIVKAVAFFEIPLQDGIDKAGIEEWQDANEMLDLAISFQWDGIETDEDLSLTNYDELSFSIMR
jgi:hypothetical protein